MSTKAVARSGKNRDSRVERIVRGAAITEDTEITPTTSLRLRPTFPDGLVVSTCPVASGIGMRILREGGNAADAAVAVGLALAVTYPQAGNLGGGGFGLIVDQDGDDHHKYLLDFREVAPRGVRSELFLDLDGGLSDACRIGGLATAVPGTIAGFAALVERFGRLSWDRVVAPVVDLAERGFWLTTRQAMYFRMYRHELSRFSFNPSLFRSVGFAPLPGTKLCQADLAQTLRILADKGPRDFYEGGIADAVVREVRTQQGVMDAEDLADYEIRWREPLQSKYLGWDVWTTPPPSGGGFTLALALKLLERMEAHRLRPESVDRIELIARVLRVACYYRRELIGDPDFMSEAEQKEVAGFLNSSVLDRSFETLEAEAVKAPHDQKLGSVVARGGNTTHFCVLDKDRLSVSITYSLNTLFGNKLCVDGHGFLLNNSIDDFQIAPGAQNWYAFVDGERNRIGPRRRPAGSMAPTTMRLPGRAQLSVGAAGGPRIPSLLTQIALSIAADRTSLAEAMHRPRIHHQCWPDRIYLEDGVTPAVRDALKGRGYETTLAASLGIGAGILSDLAAGTNTACLDSRFSAL